MSKKFKARAEIGRALRRRNGAVARSFMVGRVQKPNRRRAEYRTASKARLIKGRWLYRKRISRGATR